MNGAAGEPVDHAAVRRNTRRMMLFVAGLLVVGILGGVLVAVAKPDGEHRARPFALGLVIVMLLVALVLCFLLLRVMIRRSSFRNVMQYGWFERRAAYKAVKAGRPLSDRQVSVVRASLAYAEKTGWTVWIWPALCAIWVLDGLTHHGWLRWMMLGVAAVYVVLLPVMVWERRRVLERYRGVLALL